MLVAKLRGARERMRARGERAEGAFPFGYNRTEPRVLHRLQELKASGLTYAQVADAANAEGLSTLFGARIFANRGNGDLGSL